MKPKVRFTFWRLIKRASLRTGLGLGAAVLFLALRPEGRFIPADGASGGEANGITILIWNILRGDGNVFRVYNVHLHLHPLGQTHAARFLAGRIRESIL